MSEVADVSKSALFVLSAVAGLCRERKGPASFNQCKIAVGKHYLYRRVGEIAQDWDQSNNFLRSDLETLVTVGYLQSVECQGTAGEYIGYKLTDMGRKLIKGQRYRGKP